MPTSKAMMKMIIAMTSTMADQSKVRSSMSSVGSNGTAKLVTEVADEVGEVGDLEEAGG